ncbi:uncharacterized protein TNCV_2011421 [Trichonephila clavipes]|nr:uncharacterized protein TNCV_2011421 [Trichonephila clavipes]
MRHSRVNLFVPERSSQGENHSTPDKPPRHLEFENVKEGRFVQGIFRSERMRVIYRSRQNDRLRVMLVLVHIDITPPHTPLPVFRRIGERTIPYCGEHVSGCVTLVGCVIRV